MRKAIAIITAASLALGLSACGDNENSRRMTFVRAPQCPDAVAREVTTLPDARNMTPCTFVASSIVLLERAAREAGRKAVPITISDAQRVAAPCGNGPNSMDSPVVVCFNKPPTTLVSFTPNAIEALRKTEPPQRPFGRMAVLYAFISIMKTGGKDTRNAEACVTGLLMHQLVADKTTSRTVALQIGGAVRFQPPSDNTYRKAITSGNCSS